MQKSALVIGIDLSSDHEGVLNIRTISLDFYKELIMQKVGTDKR